MRVNSILFIDDEKIIRESFLSLVDWEKNKFKVVGAYSNGAAAAEYLKKHSVDIILSDINMPFFNGIELLEFIRRNNMKTRVILLTGYEYFEYASKAVQLKAFDFLLKPVTTEKLLEAVKKASYDIEREEMVEMSYVQWLRDAQSTFINRIFHEKMDRNELIEESKKCKFNIGLNHYQIVYLAIDTKKGKLFSEEKIVSLKNHIYFQVLECKKEIEESYCVSFALYMAKNISRHLYFLIGELSGECFTDDMMRKFVEEIIDLARNEEDYTITVGIGKKITNLLSAEDAFRHVSDALKKRHITGVGKIFFASNSASIKSEVNSIVLPTDTFLQHIRMGEVGEAEKDISSIYESLRKKETLSLESARMVTTELAITVFKGQISDKDASVSSLHFLNKIQQLNTLDEMEICIQKLAIQITERRNNTGSRKSRIAEKALEYLHNNYWNEELNLNDVASYLNISIPYLAVLFKQETCQNFSSHLLTIRMEKAKELLRTTDMTVSEVSERIGYSSAQYFAVCFKKHVGVSPSIFKNQRENSAELV